MVGQLTAEGRHYPGLVRVAAAVVAIFAGLLAGLQAWIGVDFAFQEHAWDYHATAIVAVFALDALSVAALGVAAWTLGRFAAGQRLAWLLSVALLVAGVGLTLASWIVWIANLSGG